MLKHDWRGGQWRWGGSWEGGILPWHRIDARQSNRRACSARCQLHGGDSTPSRQSRICVVFPVVEALGERLTEWTASMHGLAQYLVFSKLPPSARQSRAGPPVLQTEGADWKP